VGSDQTASGSRLGRSLAWGVLGLALLGIPVGVVWSVTMIDHRQGAADVIAGLGQLAVLPSFVLMAFPLVRGLRLGWESAIPTSRAWHVTVFAAGCVGCTGNALRVGLSSAGSRSVWGAVIWTGFAAPLAARAVRTWSRPFSDG
jgi:hypothetical protein